MSTGQANRASVLTSASFLWRMWCESTAFRHPACSSKGTVRFINGIALDECLARERYPARRPFRIPEREADRAAQSFRLFESAGCELVEETSQGFDAFVPIAQSTERECPKLQVAGESPAGDAIRGRSSPVERSLDTREAERAALSAPTICPCGVVQPTCLPLMQEITGAKPVRDAILSARG